MNYVQAFLMTNSSNFPADSLPYIQRELSELDDQAINSLLATEIKNPTTGLLLALFLGEWGADRFYNKDISIAIGKLALTILGILTSWIGIGLILLMAVYVWKIVDCCLIMGAIRQGNLERLLFNIQYVKLTQSHNGPLTGVTPSMGKDSGVVAVPAAETTSALEPEENVPAEVLPVEEDREKETEQFSDTE